MVAAGFVPWRVRPHIDSISCPILKMYLSLTDKKDNIVCTMKQNHTKHVCFTFFDPLKFTMSSWGQTRTRWVRTPHWTKPASYSISPQTGVENTAYRRLAKTTDYRPFSLHGLDRNKHKLMRREVHFSGFLPTCQAHLRQRELSTTNKRH